MREKEKKPRHRKEKKRKRGRKRKRIRNLMDVCVGREGGAEDVPCRMSACRDRKKEREDTGMSRKARENERKGGKDT